jgi:WD40 repeat protein
MKKPVLFLSHSGSESRAASELAKHLEEAGVDVWLDLERLRPGDRWMGSIESALMAADAFAVYIGAAGIRSWVDFEVRAAIERTVADPGFRVFPILGPGALPGALPIFLHQFQWLLLEENGRSTARKLQQLLGTILDNPPASVSLLAEGQAPFRGLLPFRTEDALIFYGRDRETEEIVHQLQGSSFLAVLGESGCGKSSVVRAGVVPVLQRGRFSDGKAWIPEWHTVVFRPADDPFRELADALPDLHFELAPSERIRVRGECAKRLAAGDEGLYSCIASLVPAESHTLLVVDQLEELFTQTKDADLRRRFLDSLLQTIDGRGDRRVYALVTLRADFYSRCWEHPALLARIAAHQYPLGRLNATALREVIEKPLTIAGAKPEAGLVDTILSEVGDEPGALPLLEHALLELWESRSGAVLTHKAYQEIGRLAGALNQYAEDVFTTLGTRNEPLVRTIFLRLSQKGEGTGDTRRRATRQEIMALGENEATCADVLSRLIESRLVTARSGARDEDTVFEIAHEALIHGWIRLKTWLQDDHEFLLWRQRLELRRSEWERTGGADEALLPRAALLEAQRWQRGRTGELNAAELGFIATSALAERHRRKKHYLTILAAVSVLLTLLAGLLWQASRRTQEREQLTLLREAADTPDPLVGALLLNEIGAGKEPPDGASIARRIADHRLPIWVGRVEPGAYAADASFSPDGSRILAISEAHTIWIWRADGAGSPVVLRGHTDSVNTAFFSPDSQHIVTAANDGTARIWQITGKGEPVVLNHGQGIKVLTASFSPDGKRVVTGAGDGTARVWPVDGHGKPRVLGGHQSHAVTANFSPNGAFIITGEALGPTQLWKSDGTGKPILLGKDLVGRRADFSLDGTRILLARRGGAAILKIEGDSVQPETSVPKRDLSDAAFFPGGRSVILTSYDSIEIQSIAGQGFSTRRQENVELTGKVAIDPAGRALMAPTFKGSILWNLNENHTEELAGHEGLIASVAFDRAGTQFVTAGFDGSVRLWSATDPAEPLVISNVSSIDLSPDGTKILATVAMVARIWSINDSQNPVVLATDATRARFTANGENVVLYHRGGAASIQRINGRLLWRVPRVDSSDLSRVVPSPDERHAATISQNRADGSQELRIWTIGDPTPLALIKEKLLLNAVFSPDGRLLALTFLSGGHVKLWSTDEQKSLVSLGAGGKAIFSPDGAEVATISENDRIARIWATDGKLLAKLPHDGGVKSLSFSPKGDLLVTTADDGMARLWTRDGVERKVFKGPHPTWAELSSDGSRILVINRDGVRIWRTDGRSEPVFLEGELFLSASFNRDASRVLTFQRPFEEQTGTALLWRISWPGLINYLRSSTHACLTPEQRRQYLGEPKESASAAFKHCERQYGRSDQ